MKTKYPRTPHLPWSAGRTKDDRVLASTLQFEGREVVVTVKMDGENTTLYRDGFHARSIDSRHHPSRDWLANFHATIAHEIPENYRICGENLYARHSIHYTNLPTYFMGFSVWENNVALGWDDTLVYFDLIGITPVRSLYRGVWDEAALRDLALKFDTNVDEGYVVRLADSFQYADFGVSVAKWVRPQHVQTDKHWMHSSIVPNVVV